MTHDDYLAPERAETFYCKIVTSDAVKSNYNIHNSTRKHKMNDPR
jgi:hypothetical protein